MLCCAVLRAALRHKGPHARVNFPIKESAVEEARAVLEQVGPTPPIPAAIRAATRKFTSVHVSPPSGPKAGGNMIKRWV